MFFSFSSLSKMHNQRDQREVKVGNLIHYHHLKGGKLHPHKFLNHYLDLIVSGYQATKRNCCMNSNYLNVLHLRTDSGW